MELRNDLTCLYELGVFQFKYPCTLVSGMDNFPEQYVTPSISIVCLANLTFLG